MRASYRILIIGVAWLQLFAQTAGKPTLSKFVEVNGARLEYLDWGGDGPPLIFLAGLGATAHIFGDLAPEFTARYHCLGLTRRGFGRSEQTPDGYTLDNLVRDIAEFAKRLGSRRVTLIGHSYGGSEAVRASELYPDLVSRVVLLDTAYDPIPPGAPAAEEKLFAALTKMTPAEQFLSLDSARTYETRLMRNSWSPAAESDLEETVIVNPDGSLRGRTPARISKSIVSERATGAFSFSKIPCRALLIFADNPWADFLPELHLDPQTTAEIKDRGSALLAARHSQIDAFRRDSPLSKIVVLEHTEHHCFIQRRGRVVQEMNRFFADHPF